MKECLFIVCIISAFLFGYFLMKRLDRLLLRNRKALEEKDPDPAEDPSCIMLTGALTDEEIDEEIRHFRQSHSGARIFLCDRDHSIV